MADQISNPSARHFSAAQGFVDLITFVLLRVERAGAETGANRCFSSEQSRQRGHAVAPNAFCALSTHRAVIDDELVSCAVPNLHLHYIKSEWGMRRAHLGALTTFKIKSKNVARM